MTASINTAKEIKQAVLSVDSQARVVLFGSRARGENKMESDWDVLVLTDLDKGRSATRLKMLDVIYDVELKTGQIITPVIRDKAEWETEKLSSLYIEIAKYGVVL